MDLVSLPKQLVSESEAAASLPWDGVLALASHWAGAGSLFDWIRPHDWEVERDWAADIVKARMAEAVLLYVQRKYTRHLPRHSGEWLDVLGQQSQRVVQWSDSPSAHTDWAATLAEYGRYPAELYAERRSLRTFDTSLTRVLRWTSSWVGRSENLVRMKFGREALTPSARACFSSALNLPEVRSASGEHVLSEFDLLSCREIGGIWITLARIAELINALWRGTAKAQLFSLAPILPDYAHQLFELGVLGTITTAARGETTGQKWLSSSPLAASADGRATLILKSDQGTWSAFYQSIPPMFRAKSSPYRDLTKYFDGKPLRPDIWVIYDPSTGGRREIVLECKYSLNPSYISSGVPQAMAYFVEYPPEAGVARMHIVVGPEDIISTTSMWNHQIALTNPQGAGEIVRQWFKKDTSSK